MTIGIPGPTDTLDQALLKFDQAVVIERGFRKLNDDWYLLGMITLGCQSTLRIPPIMAR